MYEISVNCAGHDPFQAKLVPGVYRVGASPACHLQIQGEGIAPRHCQLVVGEQTLQVLAFNAAFPVYLDGSMLGEEPVNADPGSEIRLGNTVIKLIGPEGMAMSATYESQADIQATQQAAPPPPAPAAPSSGKSMESLLRSEQTEGGIAVLRISGVPFEKRPLLQEIKKRAHIELIKRLNLKRLTMSGVSGDALNEKARNVIHEIVGEITIPLPPEITPELLEQELIHEAIGLGPLEVLIAMPEISEIMVNGHDKIYVEYKGKLHRTDLAFADDHQVIAAIERIVSPLGRRIDESSPMVDARLKDGSRVNAIIPPLSLVGPTITIRKFAKRPLTVQNLIAYGSITPEIAHFLDVCVKIRKNILISGGTGSGKTTLLNILSGYLPDKERIITIEDAAELQLRQEHLVRLESRPANIEGKGEVTIRDLVRNSLRMRPDRIVIGECRGGEALDMLQAMNTGHDGSLTTIHANSPRDALARLETLVLMAGFDLPLRAIREQIASAISVIVQINREKDGSRKVVCVSEITKMEGDVITMQDLFTFKQDGWTEDGRVAGHFEPTGAIPTFMEDIRRANLDLDISMFTPAKRRVES